MSALAESPPTGFTFRHTLRGHTAGLQDLAWSPDGHRLASGDTNRMVRIWDTQNGQMEQEFKLSNRPYNLAWSSNGSMLAAGLYHKAGEVWNTQPYKRLAQLQYAEMETCSSYSVDWSPNGRLLATAHKDEAVRIWQVGNAISGLLGT